MTMLKYLMFSTKLSVLSLAPLGALPKYRNQGGRYKTSARWFISMYQPGIWYLRVAPKPLFYKMSKLVLLFKKAKY
jgi:hypothetical protein